MSAATSAPVVVAYVPDRHGRAALDQGLAEARRRGSSVVVVNGTRGDALVDERFAGSADVDELTAELAGTGVPFEVRRPMGPDVAEQVLDVADEVDAGLIVLGLRRRTPVGKLIMGSVSQRILLDAGCPVLAVKAGD